MRVQHTIALAALAVVSVTAGCNSFLEGPGVSTNPNKPTSATADQLFVGVQVGVMGQWENYPSPGIQYPLWAQSIQGVARQFIPYSQYQTGIDDGLTNSGTQWDFIYDGGGLADIRRVEQGATDANNLKLRGMTRVLEALIMATATDTWGDIPYSESFGNSHPTFDKQADVFAHVIAVLDSAQDDFAANQGDGPNTADFFFGNDASKWSAAAHTLKARIIMHTSRGADSAAKFAAAKAEAQLGISSIANQMQSVHTANVGEINLFYSLITGARNGDIEPSKIPIDLMKALGDTKLLEATYIPTAGGFFGSSAGASIGANVAKFAIAPDSPLPIISYAENQMILAETQYRTGDVASAHATFDAFRTAAGETNTAPIPGGANGLLVAILQEKYVRQFVNSEAYFDYLRTCVPNIPLPAVTNPGINYVPARLAYPQVEKVANSANVPPDGSPTNHGNANFPRNLTDPSGAVCAGQHNRVDPAS